MKEEKNGSKEYPKSPWWPLTCRPGCVYRAADGGCNYWSMEDGLRGCDPGRDCDRYRNKREKKRDRTPVILPGTPKHMERLKGKAGCGWDNHKGFELWKSGVAMAQIARMLGTTATAVWARKREHWVFGRP